MYYFQDEGAYFKSADLLRENLNTTKKQPL